jgi:hypothetical protein
MAKVLIVLLIHRRSAPRYGCPPYVLKTDFGYQISIL